MLKLISVNIERDRHYNTIFPFLDEENPDVICIQEAPENFSQKLIEHGYETTFAPMSIRDLYTI